MKLKTLISLWLLLLIFPISLLAQQKATGQQSKQFEKRVTKELQSSYLLYLPESYNQRKEKLPLIMYLHGGSLRSSDIEKVRNLGLPQILENKRDFPFIVVSPQCPGGEIWTDTDTLIGILDEVTRKYAVDADRIYLTGHSMGGRGTLYLAYKHPEKFAAIAPLSSFSIIAAWAEKLRNVPIWAFHGAKDEIAPLSDSQSLFDEIKKNGGDVKFTILPDRDHFILDTYENEDLYKWFLQHKRVTR